MTGKECLAAVIEHGQQTGCRVDVLNAALLYIQDFQKTARKNVETLESLLTDERKARKEAEAKLAEQADHDDGIITCLRAEVERLSWR